MGVGAWRALERGQLEGAHGNTAVEAASARAQVGRASASASLAGRPHLHPTPPPSHRPRSFDLVFILQDRQDASKDAMLAEKMMDTAAKLGAFKSSMLQDVEAHRAVELDALVSAVRELGQRTGVDTPFTDALLGLSRVHAQGLGLYPAPSGT